MRTFISYARQDQAAVEALNADLERARVDVWMDEELTGGESWWDTILEQIRSCDLYIFALSPNSLRSRACKAELEYALARIARCCQCSSGTLRFSSRIRRSLARKWWITGSAR